MDRFQRKSLVLAVAGAFGGLLATGAVAQVTPLAETAATLTGATVVRLSGASAQDLGLRNVMRRICLPGTMTQYTLSNQNAYLCSPNTSQVSGVTGNLNALLSGERGRIARYRNALGNLAHSLKTPLAILSGEANKLKRAGRLDEADVVRNQVETMEQHIERELARARTNPSSPAYGVRTDASLATNRLVDMMRRIPSEKPLTWRVEIAPGLMLHMDPHDFSEALGNLLDNSRKWAASDVLVRGTIAGDRAFVCVEDDGPGVPEDQRGVVTERGWRGREDAKGSGLGLAIARDVLSEYGSGLEIGAREGGGSRFGFTLPAEIRAEASIAEPPRLRAAE